MTRRDRPQKAQREALLSVRAALILLLGVLSGAATAILTASDGHSVVESALAGLAALAAGVRFFHWLVG